MPIIDFTQVKGLEPIPVGEYLAKVVFAEEGLSSSNHPKIEMRWEVIAPAPFAGRQIFDILSFHPDAQYRTKLLLVGMGFDSTYQGEITAESLMNREAAIVLSIEDSGKTDDDGNPYPPRNKVRKIRSATRYGQGNAALESLAPPTEVVINKAKSRK